MEDVLAVYLPNDDVHSSECNYVYVWLRFGSDDVPDDSAQSRRYRTALCGGDAAPEEEDTVLVIIIFVIIVTIRLVHGSMDQHLHRFPHT